MSTVSWTRWAAIALVLGVGASISYARSAPPRSSARADDGGYITMDVDTLTPVAAMSAARWTTSLSGLSVPEMGKWRPGSIASIAVGRSAVALLDLQNSAALLIDRSTGTPLTVVGGFGQGPREFDEPSDIEWLSNMFIIADPHNQKIVCVGEDGSWGRTISIDDRLDAIAVASDTLLVVRDKTGHAALDQIIGGCRSHMQRKTLAMGNTPARARGVVAVDGGRIGMTLGDSIFLLTTRGRTRQVLVFRSASEESAGQTGGGAPITFQAAAATPSGKSLLVAVGNRLVCFDISASRPSRVWSMARYRQRNAVIGALAARASDLIVYDVNNALLERIDLDCR